MGTNWLGGAKVIKAVTDGGSMKGGNPRATWHTTENDPKKTSATAIANFLNRSRNCVHIVWNPVTGEIVQMIPANRAGRGLRNKAGGVETNRAGSVNIQIEVVGQAAHPFTTNECKNLDVIVAWLRTHGIKDVFPAGTPRAYPASYGESNPQRSIESWTKNGHFGHSQVPENSHGDPGMINVGKILTAGIIQGRPSSGGNVKVPLAGYKVVKGDSLWGISMKFKVTVAAIKAANKLKSDLLSVGQVLKIPSKVSKPKERIVVSNVQYGKSNDDVRFVQAELRKLVGLQAVDGDFGPKTRAAWIRFQSYLGVPKAKQNGIPTKSGIQALGFKNVV